MRVALYARGNSVAQLSDPAVLAEASSVLKRELDIRFQSQVVSVRPEESSAVTITR